MVRSLAIAIAIIIALTCVLLQAAQRADAFAGRGRRDVTRRRRQAAADRWLWDADNSAAEDVARGRLLNLRLRPAGTDAALSEYFSGVLSTACCNAGRTFDISTRTCRGVATEPDQLTGRSGITTLPPNCPPPTKYDPETKRCREIWD